MLKFCICLFLTTFCLAESKQAIVFDFGGVVAKVDRAKIINFLTDTFQVSEEELKPALTGWKKTLESNGDEKEYWYQYAASKGIILPENWFEQFENANAFIDIPGTIEIVKHLQEQGYQTPMLSNIQQYQANQVRKFDYYNLFHPVLLSYEINAEKPHEEAYRILLSRLQLPASEVIFIDDQLVNVEAAQKLGIDSIQFINSEKLKEELEKRGIK